MLAAVVSGCSGQDAASLSLSLLTRPPSSPGSQVMVVYVADELNPVQLVSTAKPGVAPAGWWV